VRDVGDEPALRVEGPLEAIEHRVEGVGEFRDLVPRAEGRDAPVKGGLGQMTREVPVEDDEVGSARSNSRS